MKRMALALIVAAAACGLAEADGPEKKSPRSADEPPMCDMRLKNGSLIKGALKPLGRIKLKTRYGSLELPMDEVRSLSWGETKKEELDTVDTRHGAFRGWIDDIASIELDTGFGILKVPTTAIRSMRVRRPGQGIGDDFESGTLEAWTTFGPSSFRIQDGQLRIQPSGQYDSIQLKEELEGNYTFEVDVSNAQNAVVLWGAKDAQNATALWLSPGSARVFGGGTWYSSQLATWSYVFTQSSTLHVKVEVEDGKSVVSINGTRLGEIGIAPAGRIGLMDWSGTASFDNVVVTR